MNSPKQSSHCAICCNTFTKARRAPISCKKCGLRACCECLQKYILTQESLTQIKCMIPSCDCIWDRAFLAESLTQVFMRKRYPQRRGELLYQHALSRMPETMPYVERQKQINVLEEESKEIRKQALQVRTLLREYNQKLYTASRTIRQLRWNQPITNQEAREFVRQCPVDNCRGFLSTQWRCKVCDTYVCAKCHVIKGKVPKGIKPTMAFPNHHCKENDILSVEALKKDTKPCPSCGVPINKISGCDQMWCTQCQVAFSWRTGRRINGIIHNPHFYQWQRTNGGGVAPRAQGDVRCGGFPGYAAFRRKMYAPNGATRQHWFNQYHVTDGGEYPSNTAEAKGRGFLTWGAIMISLHRHLMHFNQVEVRPWRARADNDEEREMRVKYILGDKDKAWLTQQLISVDKRKMRRNDIYHVMQLMDNVAMERMINVINEPTLANAKICVSECTRVRDYCNNELKKISAIDGLVVPIIQENFYTASANFSKKDVGW